MVRQPPGSLHERSFISALLRFAAEHQPLSLPQQITAGIAGRWQVDGSLTRPAVLNPFFPSWAKCSTGYKYNSKPF